MANDKHVVVVLNCGGARTYYSFSKEGIMSNIMYGWRLRKNNWWAKEPDLIEWIEKNVIGHEFTKERATEMLEAERYDFLTRTMLGTTARDYLFWYQKWGKPQAQRDLFDVMEEEK